MQCLKPNVPSGSSCVVLRHALRLMLIPADSFYMLAYHANAYLVRCLQDAAPPPDDDGMLLGRGRAGSSSIGAKRSRTDARDEQQQVGITVFARCSAQVLKHVQHPCVCVGRVRMF
jgi:hypothetical protein